MRFMAEYNVRSDPDAGWLDPDNVATFARTLEEVGFGALAFTDHPAPSAKWLAAGGHETFDPFAALTFCAAVTRRIRLMTHLTVVPYRNPLLQARSMTTVDVLSGGRAIFALGTGYLRSEFAALGVDADERNELFDEALEVLPLHWKGDPFSYTGKHFSARDVIARPRPVQDPIPIWIGGNSKLTLRRVAQKVQGWMPLGGPAELFTTTRTAQLATTEAMAAKIRELRDLAGERGAQLDIAPAYLDATINRPDQEADRHREAFQTLADAGVTNLIISAPGGSPKESLEFIEAFGATYL